MKKKQQSNKALKTAHTANTPYGMGDYYGSGVRNPMGKVKEGMGITPVGNKGLKTPPRRLA
jgi:hypothetical protein